MLNCPIVKSIGLTHNYCYNKQLYILLVEYCYNREDDHYIIRAIARSN